jgi:hypothetical protein
LVLRERGAEVAPAELAEPFFVLIAPLAMQFVPNDPSNWAAESRLALRLPGITDAQELKCCARIQRFPDKPPRIVRN